MIDGTHIGLAGVVAMLALIGVAGITLLPLRAYTRLRGHARGWAESPANRAGGAISLAVFGAIHLGFEAAALAAWRIARNRGTSA
jgi:hypothetical protein